MGTAEQPELEIQQRATAWMDAAFRRDFAACSDFLADDFTMVTDRGSQIDKAQWLSTMQHRVGGTEPPAFLDVQVLVVGDTAVMSSRTSLPPTVDGEDGPAEILLTDVWVRRGGRWQLVRRHASREVPGAR